MADDDEPGRRDDDDESYAEAEEEHSRNIGSIDERITRLEEAIRRLGGDRARGTVTASKAAEAEDRRREMSDALADLRRQERADRTMRGLGADVKKLKAEVFEKPPRQFRKVEMFMGWADRD